MKSTAWMDLQQRVQLLTSQSKSATFQKQATRLRDQQLKGGKTKREFSYSQLCKSLESTELTKADVWRMIFRLAPLSLYQFPLFPYCPQHLLKIADDLTGENTLVRTKPLSLAFNLFWNGNPCSCSTASGDDIRNSIRQEACPCASCGNGSILFCPHGYHRAPGRCAD